MGSRYLQMGLMKVDDECLRAGEGKLLEAETPNFWPIFFIVLYRWFLPILRYCIIYTKRHKDSKKKSGFVSSLALGKIRTGPASLSRDFQNAIC